MPAVVSARIALLLVLLGSAWSSAAPAATCGAVADAECEDDACGLLQSVVDKREAVRALQWKPRQEEDEGEEDGALAPRTEDEEEGKVEAEEGEKDGEVVRVRKDGDDQDSEGVLEDIDHPSTDPDPHPIMGWRKSRRLVGPEDAWCRAEVPVASWSAHSPCPFQSPQQQLQVMTYNLYWWNLFNRHKGNGGSAGKLIAKVHRSAPLDVIGFQECGDADRVLRDADLLGSLKAVEGLAGLAVAYRPASWELLGQGSVPVAEDQQDEFYGKRYVQWMRLQSRSSDKAVFVLNHHGPLRVGSGGRCGGAAVGYNILRVIGQNAHVGDFIVMVGDFNAGRSSKTVKTLEKHLSRLYTGRAFGGIDHIFASCGSSLVSKANHGGAGSDHDALSATLNF